MAPEGDQLPPVVILLGPTGSGKTALGVEWAERLGGEIVSADSVQVYRYMDIGTAKPSPEIRERIPHYVIDVVYPDEVFSASRFQVEADKAIHSMHLREKVSLVVGGTGLYIKALTKGLCNGPDRDDELRGTLREEAQASGTDVLYRRLQGVDPEAAKRIHPNDLMRIVRALEVYYRTGIPVSEHQRKHGFAVDRYRALYLGLHVERSTLYGRINTRVDSMIAQGFVEEVEGLLRREYHRDLPSMGAIGYRHACDYIAGGSSLSDMIESMKRDTRQYARRQETWFKRMANVTWFQPAERHRILESIERFLH